MFNRLFDVKPDDTGIKYLIKATVKSFVDNSTAMLGGQLAYFTFLSVFPFIIVVNTIIGYLDISYSSIINILSPVLPQYIANIIAGYVDYLSQIPSIGTLSVGILFTLYSSTKAMRSLIYSVNRAYSIEKKRAFIHNVALSMILTILLAIAITSSAVFIAFSSTLFSQLAGKFNMPVNLISLLNKLSILITAGILLVVLMIIYCIMPNKKIKLTSVIPGTVFAILGWGLLNWGFSIYVKYFSNYSVLYGSIGTVILIMLWLYLMEMVLIIGAQINSAWETMPRKKKLKTADGQD